MFEHSARVFEVLLVACSQTEASVWRDRLAGRIAVETQHLAEGRSATLTIGSPLTDEIRPVGKAYGKTSDFSSRVSVHRTATLGPMTEWNQVMIKNTLAAKESFENPSTSSLPIPRSQSVMTPSHIPVLAPRRSERIHLEQALSDVWTREAIPYPGMGSRRPDFNIRASTNSVMRKLSMASIASNFSKRSMSYTSISQASTSDSRISKPKPAPPPLPNAPKKLVRKPLVDFHNAPDAFLPEDFELRDPKKQSRLGGLRTMTMERPRSPFFAAENSKPPNLKRAQSVKTKQEVQTQAQATISANVPYVQQRAPSRVLMKSPPPTRETANTSEDVITVAKKAKAKLRKLLG